MAFYDSKPSVLEAVGNGSYRYRFDIEQVTVTANQTSEQGEDQEQPAHTQWQCEEVTVWPPITANRILEAVITECVPATREQKLVNDYNAAQLGMVGGSKTSDAAKERIAAYKEFLQLRADLKAQVDGDCAELGIY